ncbi:MAG: hypothetical protein LBH82_04000 [Bacteroidales bacterium]|nr:hypothetical protein [Bacteroidales bacterium]
MNEIAGFIPARCKSVCFEEKSLADICGKPMIGWEYRRKKLAAAMGEMTVFAIDNNLLISMLNKTNTAYQTVSYQAVTYRLVS